MFESKSNIFGATQAYNSIPSYKKKANMMRSTIRRKQINEYFSSIREEMLSSLVEDYQVLKQINLNSTLQQLAESTFNPFSDGLQKLQKITNDLFIYSHSNQSDHLYYLFDSRIINKLVCLAHRPQDFSESPRSYIRILYVLANYSLYSDEKVGEYIQITARLFSQITKIQGFYYRKASYLFFSCSQTKQILYLALQSVANDCKDGQFISKLCLQPSPKESLVAILLDQCIKINNFCKESTIKGTFVSDILIKIVCIFQKILEFTGGCDLADLLSVDFEIINSLLLLLNTLSIKQKQTDAEYRIMLILQQFIITHLQQNPNILLSHPFGVLLQLLEHYSQQFIDLNFQIANYHSLLQIEGSQRVPLASLNIKSKQLQKRLKILLNIFNLFYSINIPQDRSNQYQQILENWLVDCLLPVFRRIFKINNELLDEVHHAILQLLKNICLEESFCDYVLDELHVLNKMFYYILSGASGVRMRKAALEVLNSIICITLYDNGDLKDIVLDLLTSNQIIPIFIYNLCEYADNQLNINLLNSLQTYLETESYEANSQHSLWTKFCVQGGKEKLQKSLQTVQNAQSIQIIRLLLDKYDRS